MSQAPGCVLRAAALLLALVLAPSVGAQSVAGGDPLLIRELVGELGTDPAALTAWVGANVRSAPYRGALRGAEGTISAGSGSAADQALLVHALVRAANPSAQLRFATCSLAGQELDRSRAAAAAAPVPRPTILLEELGGYGTDVPGPERGAVSALAGAWASLTSLTARHAALLADALAEYEEATGLNASLVAAPPAPPSEHVWVQLEQDSAWMDLDPTAATIPGARCSPTATSFELPVEFAATLTLRVVVENRVNGAPTETTLLAVGAPLAEASTATFAVAEAFGDDLTGAREATEDGLLRYTPVVLLGSETSVGEPFFLPTPAGAVAPDGLSGLGGVLDGVFGALGGESTEPSEAADPTAGATALWLELTLQLPEGATSVRAEVFDRIGFAARAGGQAATAVPAPLAELDGEYTAVATIWSVGAFTGRWWYGGAPSEPVTDLTGAAAALAALHSGYELVRQALVEAVAGRAGAPWPAGPTLSVLGWRPSTADATRADLVMDVLHDPGPMAGAAGAHRTELEAAATWAVASVVAERLLVDHERLLLTAFGEPAPEGPEALDLPALFDSAAQHGLTARWYAGGELPVGASPQAAARAAAHMAQGTALYAPEAAVAQGDEVLLGWWLLSPFAAGARVRDELETGRHTAGVEYSATTQPSRTAAPAFRKSLGRRLVCTIGRAIFVFDLMSALSGNPGGGQVARGLAEGVAAVREAADKTRQAGRSVGGGCSAGAGPGGS